MRIDLTIHKGDGGASASALSLSLTLHQREGAQAKRVGVNRTSLLRGGNSIIARHTPKCE